jgi:hypothetical protein
MPGAHPGSCKYGEGKELLSVKKALANTNIGNIYSAGSKVMILF